MSNKTKPRNGSFLYWSAETWAFLTLRLFLALRFITAGLGKFQSESGYSFSTYYEGVVPWMMNEFQTKSALPAFILAPYVYTIAYVQLILGILLLLGVKTKYTLAVTGLTYVSLAFGQMLIKGHSTVAEIGIHLLLTAAALYFVRHNKLELKR